MLQGTKKNLSYEVFLHRLLARYPNSLFYRLNIYFHILPYRAVYYILYYSVQHSMRARRHQYIALEEYSEAELDRLYIYGKEIYVVFETVLLYLGRLPLPFLIIEYIIIQDADAFGVKEMLQRKLLLSRKGRHIFQTDVLPEMDFHIFS